ncbi:MAG: hypothetical protein JST92_21270, partial [Deltaproteobacteria bacterium]|nr:hypothetical protein [Deltaproteobacteria bacterium]
LLVAIFVTEHFLRYPDGGWDARAIWNHHARLLARVPHRLDLVFAPEHNHADYPLLLPGLVAHLWLASGNETPLVPALVAAAFALLGTLALLSSVHTLSARWFERDALPPSVRAASVALLLWGTPIFLTQTWIQCADLPLAMLTLLAIALVLRGSIAAAGLAAGLGALTKNDGALWLAALALVLLSTQRTSLPRFMRGALAPIAALAHLKLRLAPENDLAQNARGEVLVRLVTLSRWWDAVKGLVREVWHVEAFGISLMAALAISVLLARGLRTEPAIARLPRKFLTPALLAILVVYVVGAPDVDHMARNSADRLLFQLWPTALLALALGTRLRLRADVA